MEAIMAYKVELLYSNDGSREGAPATLMYIPGRSRSKISVAPAGDGEYMVEIPIELGESEKDDLKQVYGLFWEDRSPTKICGVIERLIEEAFLAGMEFQRTKKA
jgi:hypothetical protein